MIDGLTSKDKKDAKIDFHEDQVAGHVGTIRFDGHKLYKIGANAEASHYKYINSPPVIGDDFHNALVLLAPITSKYYGSVEIESHGKKRVESCIENLHCNQDVVSSTCSIMDIKMGTSTLTQNRINKGEDFIKQRTLEDAETTSSSLGFVIDGYCIRDIHGNKTETGFKTHKQVTAANVTHYLKKILVDEHGQVDENIRASLIHEIKKIGEIVATS